MTNRRLRVYANVPGKVNGHDVAKEAYSRTFEIGEPVMPYIKHLCKVLKATRRPWYSTPQQVAVSATSAIWVDYE